MKYCPECGAALRDKAVYCTNCGAKLDPHKVVRIPQERIVTPQKEKKKTFKFDDDTRVIYPRTERDYIRQLEKEEKVNHQKKTERPKPKKETPPPEVVPEEEKHRSLVPFFLIALLISVSVAIAAAFLIPYAITHFHSQVETVQQAKEEKEADDYVIATSSSVELTSDDLKDLSRKQLRIAKNEIYARNGYIFTSSDLSSYFNKKDWYKTRIKQSDATSDQNTVYKRMSKIEKENIAFMIKYGKSKGWSV